jgi:hypothetical protein
MAHADVEPAARANATKIPVRFFFKVFLQSVRNHDNAIGVYYEQLYLYILAVCGCANMFVMFILNGDNTEK